MVYEIKNVNIEKDNIKTVVEVTLSNGTKKNFDIVHQKPQTKEEVLNKIKAIEKNEEKTIVGSKLTNIRTELNKLIGVKR
jgi:hypothetical protein